MKLNAAPNPIMQSRQPQSQTQTANANINSNNQSTTTTNNNNMVNNHYLTPSALLTHQNINLYNSIPNHLFNILNSRSTPNSLYSAVHSSQLPPYPASTVSCLSYQGGLGLLKPVLVTPREQIKPILSELTQKNQDCPLSTKRTQTQLDVDDEGSLHTHDDHLNIVDDDDEEHEEKCDESKCDEDDMKEQKKSIKWSRFQLKAYGNFDDADDIKDDHDYFALKLERRRSYPFVERELHLGKLLKIRSRVNDKLRQEKRSLKTKIDEVQNTSTELWTTNEELKEKNMANIRKLQNIKKDLKNVLAQQSNDQLLTLFDTYFHEQEDESEDVISSPSIKTQEMKENGSIISCRQMDHESACSFDKISIGNHELHENILQHKKIAVGIIEESALSEESCATEQTITSTNATTSSVHNFANHKYLNRVNLNKNNTKMSGAKLQKRRLNMWNDPKYNINENSTTMDEDDTDNDNMEQLKNNLMANGQQYIIDFIEKFGSYEKCASYLQNVTAQQTERKYQQSS